MQLCFINVCQDTMKWTSSIIERCFYNLFLFFIQGLFLFNSLPTDLLLKLGKKYDFSCGMKCQLIWDGYGRWAQETWKPYLKGNVHTIGYSNTATCPERYVGGGGLFLYIPFDLPTTSVPYPLVIRFTDNFQTFYRPQLGTLLTLKIKPVLRTRA